MYQPTNEDFERLRAQRRNEKQPPQVKELEKLFVKPVPNVLGEPPSIKLLSAHIEVDIAFIKKMVHEFDKYDERTADFKVAVILLSSLHVGMDEGAIAKFTGYSYMTVMLIGVRLRENNIWLADGTANYEWMDETEGDVFVRVAFALCVLVGTGKIRCISEEQIMKQIAEEKKHD